MTFAFPGLADERGATSVSFDQVVARNQRLNESQARTREAVDQLARQLRNLASPTPEQPQAVDRASPYELVFQTVDPSGPGSGGNPGNVKRVRYCLDDPSTGAATLWEQSQTWTTAAPPVVPPSAACPDPAWPGTPRILARGLTNRAGVRDSPLFQFNAPSDTPAEVSAVVVQAWVQALGEGEPEKGLLRTQVLLRNQNKAPVCDPQATSAGILRVVLNGSASYDPEGRELTYEWFDASEGRSLGAGIVVEATLTVPGWHDIVVTARDPGGLECRATRSVWVPA
jgi:hypothetical protein